MIRGDTTRRWVAALRSGDFAQGRHTLCQIDHETGKRTYCCIGVLAEIAGKLVDGTANGYVADPADPGQRCYNALPDALLDEIGMTAQEQGRLISLNDDRRADFNEIANEIERMMLT